MGFRAPGPGRLGMDRFLEVDRAFWALIGRDGLGPAATHDREARGKSVAETPRCRDAPVGGGGKASGRETQNMGIQRITRRLSKLGELGELGVTGVFFVYLSQPFYPLQRQGLPRLCRTLFWSRLQCAWSQDGKTKVRMESGGERLNCRIRHGWRERSVCLSGSNDRFSPCCTMLRPA